tara:strand:- start:6491 stop:7936 length:1446 start_codon:yes stop_codon:yes gene_type:complete
MYMAFSSTGPLDLQTIGQAAGDTAPHSLSEYYNISFTDGTSSPSAGTISISDFLGKTIGSGGTWSQQQKFVSPDASYADLFGYSVSISGDYAMVGAARESPGFPIPGGMQYHTYAGAVYVYKRTGTSWAYQQRLTASDVQPYDNFGHSVSIDGDYAIVGAPYEDPNGIGGGGSAYIYVRSGTTWYEQAKLYRTAQSTTNAFFGWSVDISGDTVIIGAYRANSQPNPWTFISGAGTAYIYVRSGASWAFQARLNASDRGQYDFFGYSVSVDGNYAIAGAYLEDPTIPYPFGSVQTNAGSAYVYERSGTTWSQVAKLNAPDGTSADMFGNSVSVSGDNIVVGASYKTGAPGGTDSGAAYVFYRYLQGGGGNWQYVQKLTASDAAAYDVFGRSVAIDGSRIVVGAWREDPNGLTDAGSAYVFDFPPGGQFWVETTKLVASDVAGGDDFGVHVALSGNSAIVGASFKTTPGLYQSNQGAAYVFIT